jgi:hypothetical protein
MELAAHMRHAGSLDDLIAIQLVVTSIPVGVHHATEVGKMFGRVHPLAVRAVIISDRSGPGILIAAPIKDVDPDPPGPSLSSSRVENIDRSVVGMDPIDGRDMGSDQQDQGAEQSRCTPHPVGHHGTGDIDPKPIVHLRQTVKWDVIVEFGNHDMGKQSGTGFAALNRQGRHLSRHRCVAVLANEALFDMANNLHGCRHVLHDLDHLIRCFQERCPAAGRAIARRRIDPLVCW